VSAAACSAVFKRRRIGCGERGADDRVDLRTKLPMPMSVPNSDALPMMLGGATPTPAPSRSMTLDGIATPAPPTSESVAPIGTKDRSASTRMTGVPSSNRAATSPG
jgi:hypothetical protein